VDASTQRASTQRNDIRRKYVLRSNPSGCSSKTQGPLRGLRVLELGHFVAAPFAARLLADLGADVLLTRPAMHNNVIRVPFKVHLRQQKASAGAQQAPVELNEEKSRYVDLSKGESFGFLGFEFRRVRSLRGVWRAHYTPKLNKRTNLLRSLKEVFRTHQSQPIGG